MKKIMIADKCESCGLCTSESDLLRELPTGKASVAGTGLINDEQYKTFLNIIRNCPVNAIYVVEDEITKNGGTSGILELKKLIEKNLNGYRVNKPELKEFEFKKNEYPIPLSVNKYTSNFEYSSEEKASSSGLFEFETRIYSQRKSIVQAVIVNFRNKKLNKFGYYKKEKGNFYHDTNEEISNILSEIAVMANDITKDGIVLPKDFSEFEAGPDSGYDGENYCYRLRHLESMDLHSKLEKPSYYNCYISTDDNGNKYRYDLHKIGEKFKQQIAFELFIEIDGHIYDLIKDEFEPYYELVNKKIREKVSIIKTALKKCPQFDIVDENPKLSIKNDLINLINETKKIELIREDVFHSIDREYDWSHYRFKSENECRQAAQNRLMRFFDDCCGYLSIRHIPSIQEDLSAKYKIQIEKILNDFRIKVQQIYDKQNKKYPKVELQAMGSRSSGYLIDLSSFENQSSDFEREINDFIENKIIGSMGKLDINDYFTYDNSEISINSTTEYKQGLFGEKSYSMYKYLLQLRASSGFDKACRAGCKLSFEDGFIQNYLKKMVDSMTMQLEKDVISKINA